jgi:glycosyltransferase involved in cell wall biosynthesis
MGAPQSRLYETAAGLRNLGWEVKVITAMPNYPTGKVFPAYKGKFSVEEKVNSIDVLRYTLYASNSKKAIPRVINMLSFSMTCLASMLKVQKFKPDFVLTESPPLTLGLSGLMLSKLVGAKHILNVSDLWPLSAYKLGAISDGFLYRRLEQLEQFLYRKSYACLGQSQEIVSQVVKSGSQRAHLFRNGVDTSRFNKLNLEAVRPVKLRIVYAGLLGVAQGILDLCKNIDFAESGAEFHIYGDGAERKELEKYIAENESTGIFLHSPVKRDQVPDVLMQYDATIIPLIKPIFGAIPSKIYEAMAAGLPIIFAGGGEGAEIIKQYNVGWVCEPSDFLSIEKRVRELSMLETEELSLIKHNCKTTAKNVFDRNIQIKQLNDFLLSR